MAAFIPVHNDKKHNKFVESKILEDKGREVKDGFDGSWVAHPDLVKIARSVFEKNLGNKDH